MFGLQFGSATGARASVRLTLDEPKTLQTLEVAGYTFAELAFGVDPKSDNASLYAEPSYQAIVQSLTDDLLELARKDTKAGPSMKFSHRVFDYRWLRSSHARFELVGVVQRLDRLSFYDNNCGETRFIYRLAYSKPTGTERVYSRLPMTLNLVFLNPKKDGCQALAKSWSKAVRKLERGEPFGFKPEPASLKSIEVNLQAVRWPSTIRPSMGGYAEYFLRVYKKKGDRFVVGELENTPDVDRLKTDTALRKRLLAWLTSPVQLKAADDGIIRLPDEFLATKVSSVALHGTHRRANMPFSRIFSEADFKAADLSKSKFAKTPHGLLRRLNDMTCTGCHQGRTIAGFHFLGADRPETIDVNAIFVSSSPHAAGDQHRRIEFFDAVDKGQAPEPSRPLSVRPDDDDGGFGSHCGLGDDSFAGWTCKDGFECQAYAPDVKLSHTGICLPKAKHAGSACQAGKMSPHENPHKDEIVAVTERGCGAGYVCEDTSVGFPNGMCAKGSCASLKSTETCGSIAVLDRFNGCLAKGGVFSKCLRENVRPAALMRCSPAQACRDDYICVRTARGEGACIPPYFLFQLRVDGHPTAI